MIKIIIYTALSFSMLIGDELLRLKNSKIVNKNNQPVYLKGCNVGNWLMLEMWMLDYHNYSENGIEDQYSFIKTLEDRFGENKAEELMDIYRQNWIKKEDFDIIKSFGMNTVRLPFDYKLLMNSDTKPFKLKENAWYWLDFTIEIAKSMDMYVILDMHGAPGRQSRMDHSGRSGYNKLWTNEGYQDQMVWLWEKISDRYKNEPVVAAYDLLNEPWGSGDKELKKIILRTYSAIRDNNDKHIIIFPGHRWGIDFYKNIKSSKIENIIYTMHFYPGLFGNGVPKPYTHVDYFRNGLQDWIRKMEEFKAPLLVGEWNVVHKTAGGGEMMRRYSDFYEKLHWPATMWSYKVLTSTGGIHEGSWGLVTNSDPLYFVDITKAGYGEIKNWFKSFGSMKIENDEDLFYWFTTESEPSPLDSYPPKPATIVIAPDQNPLPGAWKVKDIGNALSGGQKISNEKWFVYGGGNDIWNKKDQFRFIYQKFEGDFSFKVKVDSIRDTHPYAKAGIMVRKSLNEQSAHGLINIFPTGITEFGYRLKSGETMVAQRGPEVNWKNAQLKIKKTGETVKFFTLENSDWKQIGELNTKKWGQSIYVGIATLSHDNSQLTKVQYSDINLQSY